jgi:hypothetical protein
VRTTTPRRDPSAWSILTRDRRVTIHRLLQVLTCATLAILVWLIFYPGLLSNDSLTLYSNAVTWTFWDWHPPIMAIVLALALAAGLDLGHLMLLQCLLVLFGLRALVTSCLQLPTQSPALSPTARGWLAILVVVLFLLPIGPLVFYAMTFWKDVWLTAAFLWIASYLLWAFRRSQRAPERSGWPHLIALALLLGLAGLLRHNAKVVLPAFGLCLAMVARRSSPLVRLGVVFLPLALTFSLEALLTWSFHVQRLHVANPLMAADLVGLCVKYPDTCREFPYTRASIKPELVRDRFRFGDVDPLLWSAPLIVDPDYVSFTRENPRLRREYVRALLRHPGKLASVKLEAFLNLVTPRGYAYYWAHFDIMPNTFGLTLNRRWAPVRDVLVGWGRTVSTAPLWHWISGEHLVWLLLGLGLIVRDYCRFFTRGHVNFLFEGTLLLSFVAYSLTYLLATQAWDFRYMYPTTIVVQVFVVTAGISALYQRGSRDARPANATPAGGDDASPRP